MSKENQIRYFYPNKDSDLGAGISYKDAKYVTHSKLPLDKSAFVVASAGQKIFIAGLILVLIAGLITIPVATGIAILGVLTLIYFVDFIFSGVLCLKSLEKPPEVRIKKKEIERINEKELPIYTILCPLYKEWEVLPQFVSAIERIDWPKDKLDVMLLLEEDDQRTIKEARDMGLPDYMNIVVVPHSLPKTKPKACNFGLGIAKGEYLVIYDAEDVTDKNQLKKAYLAFQKVGADVFCLQAKLNYYNSGFNWMTKLFTAEYSLWFDMILPGLQSINTTIPLGGTSNHFRTADLRRLHGWDAFNVTEDCDLGARIFKEGFRTAVFNSTTKEEANSQIKNWIRQRSRWIKGYLQTYLVHTRKPLEFLSQHGWHALIFQLVIGLRTAFIVINPLLWVMTASYFLAPSLVGKTIQSLYPPWVFYPASVSLIFGNFYYLYSYMIGLAKRRQWGLMKYIFLVPFYWLMMSIAAVKAFYQLITKPYYWEKTHHGLHLKKEKNQDTSEVEQEPLPSGWLGNFKKKLAAGLSGAWGLIAASTIAGGINLVYNIFLGRILDLAEFGIMATLGNILTVAGVFFGALGDTITHQLGLAFGKHGAINNNFWIKLRKKGVIWGEISILIWLMSIPLLQNFFKIGVLPLMLFTPVWVIGILAALNKGFLGGSQSFGWLGVFLIAEALGKLIITAGIFNFGLRKELIYTAIPFSMALGLIASQIFIGRKNLTEGVTGKKEEGVLKKFFATAVLVNLSTAVFMSLDVVLAKHYLTEIEAGEYALTALMGKIVFIVGALLGQLILPMVSFETGMGKTKAKGIRLVWGTALMSLIAFVVFGWNGGITGGYLFGEKINQVSAYLAEYGAAMLFLSTASAITSYHQSKKEYIFTAVSLISGLILIGGIMMFHDSPGTITKVVLAASMMYLWLAIGLHWLGSLIASIWLNLKALAGLFGPVGQNQSGDPNSPKILIYNWRDTKHIWAGGAEVYLHELSKRLVDKGLAVSWFCSNDGKSKNEEVVDGVQVIRRGGFFTVYLWAPIYYLLKLRGRYDVIIDSENGIPFFSPLFVKKPIIGLVHHVHQEVFRENLAPLQAWIACNLEGKLMPYLYRKVKMVTVSASSKIDMEDLGLGKRDEIEIINPGVDLKKFRKFKKTKNPSLLYLGRLKPYKSINTLIEAMTNIKEKFPETKLKIAGFGESRKNLEKLVKKVGMKESIKFLGKVSEKVKTKLMGSSWVFVYPSTMEGWGISVVEANAAGTPVVASRAPGLVDSMSNPHSGFLVPPKNKEAFAQKIEEIIGNKRLRNKLEKGAREWAQHFSWEKSSKKLEILIKSLSNK